MKNIIISLSVVFALVGCGDDDTTLDATADATGDATIVDDATADAPVDDATVGEDATPDAVPDAEPLPGTDCTSNFNDDCEANEVCDCANRDDGRCACIVGDRGTVEYGGDCAEDNKVCESSICIDNQCTVTCDAPDACLPPLGECQSALGFCVAPNDQ